MSFFPSSFPEDSCRHLQLVLRCTPAIGFITLYQQRNDGDDLARMNEYAKTQVVAAVVSLLAGVVFLVLATQNVGNLATEFRAITIGLAGASLIHGFLGRYYFAKVRTAARVIIAARNGRNPPAPYSGDSFRLGNGSSNGTEKEIDGRRSMAGGAKEQRSYHFPGEPYQLSPSSISASGVSAAAAAGAHAASYSILVLIDDTQVPLTVLPADTIGELKKKVAREQGKPEDVYNRAYLQFNGVIYTNDLTLQECCIVQDSVVKITPHG